jgi:glycosyltransferase involved in cell wall biosynthesis
MTEKSVCVTMVVKNRGWILPYTLGCLAKLDYPKELLSCFVVDDSSIDDTADILKAFKRKCRRQFGRGIDIVWRKDAVDDAKSARETRDKFSGWPHLASLRNVALEAARDSGADFQFSLDSDILVAPGILRGLLAHDRPHVAAMIFNDFINPESLLGGAPLGRSPNFGSLNPMGRCEPYRKYELDRLYPCAYTGAAYLVSRQVLESDARFAAHRSGEDISYSLAVQAAGFSCLCDTTSRCLHVMRPEILQGMICVYQNWFGVDVSKIGEDDGKSASD